jgi:hypothetical protein
MTPAALHVGDCGEVMRGMANSHGPLFGSQSHD